jgi:hypothetical protein
VGGVVRKFDHEGSAIVRKTTGLVGAVAIGSGLLAAGAPAYADSAGNNGLNLLNGDNVSVLPTQLCLNGLAGVLSNVIDVGSGTVASPQTDNCVNAPIVDHPSATSEPPAPMPASPERSAPAPAPLPPAPQPVAVLGHHAVTG